MPDPQPSQPREEPAKRHQEIPPETIAVIKPGYWTSTSGTHMTTDREKLVAMQELVTKTWRVKYTRDRRGQRVPTGAQVLNVLRVENHCVFEEYFKHKEQVKAKRRREGSLVEFPAATDGCFEDELDHDANELYLFHGTNPEAAQLIASNDFDMTRAGSAVGTMFGPGVYLAENASKSDEYAKEGSGIFMGQYALLLCRAVAGKVFTTPDKGDASPHVKSGAHDCVCGDRFAAVGTFREMIFFDSDAIYTEYIIIYTRTYDEADESASSPTAVSLPTAASPTSATPSAPSPTPAPQLAFCKGGCGRRVQPPSDGRVFKSCCRNCLEDDTHTAECDTRNAGSVLPGSIDDDGQ